MTTQKKERNDLLSWWKIGELDKPRNVTLVRKLLEWKDKKIREEVRSALGLY